LSLGYFVSLLLTIFAKIVMKKSLSIPCIFFSFGFAQDKLTYQRFRVSKKINDEYADKESPLTAEDVADLKFRFFQSRKCFCDC
jgi:hypothetical protein